MALKFKRAKLLIYGCCLDQLLKNHFAYLNFDAFLSSLDNLLLFFKKVLNILRQSVILVSHFPANQEHFKRLVFNVYCELLWYNVTSLCGTHVIGFEYAMSVKVICVCFEDDSHNKMDLDQLLWFATSTPQLNSATERFLGQDSLFCMIHT